MMYVKADDESILPYGEEVQRRQTAFLPLDLSTVVLGIGIRIIDCMSTQKDRCIFIFDTPVFDFKIKFPLRCRKAKDLL